MRTVFCYVEQGELRGDGPVEIVCDPEQGRLFIFMVRGTPEDTLAAELSHAVTVHARESWMYVGAIVGAA